MASRKVEERNEKIIRGLMKLPPNRRCINCNSLGPQYVCTNFWSFVCTTCSGIHREFTHRVKSVSMAKFTSQEVEALQNGGNQRAREIYLKDWDLQRHRLPSSSNVDKVREFIKHVYVDKRYAGTKTCDKPPIDGLRSNEKETRRASSYHSYSQSPPYDNQYEDRLYGKQASVLTRKPGSDRGLYDGNIYRYANSPGHSSQQVYEDRFANESSIARVSDYSTSSGGDPFRSGTQSPNFKGTGFNSPPIESSSTIPSEYTRNRVVYAISEANTKKNADGIPRPQRTGSSGSFGSFDSNSISLKSFNSGIMDAAPEPEQIIAIQPDKSSLLCSSVSGNFGDLDLSKVPVSTEDVIASSSSTDLFQLPGASSPPSVDLFQSSYLSHTSTLNIDGPPKDYSASPLDFFAEQQSTVILDEKSLELSVPKNEGWATFDTPQLAASNASIDDLLIDKVPFSEGDSFKKLGTFPSLHTSTQCPSFQNPSPFGSFPSVSDPWLEGLRSFQVPIAENNIPSWNAFEDSMHDLPLEVNQRSEQVPSHSTSTADPFSGLRAPQDMSNDGIERDDCVAGFTSKNVPSRILGPPSFDPSMLSFMGETDSHVTNSNSTNPFELPYDSELEDSNMFFDMSSLQTALPDTRLQSTFLGDVSQPWLPQSPVAPYIPSAPQGALAYMTGQAPSSQIPNVAPQGPVASIGGNPFE